VWPTLLYFPPKFVNTTWMPLVTLAKVFLRSAHSICNPVHSHLLYEVVSSRHYCLIRKPDFWWIKQGCPYWLQIFFLMICVGLCFNLCAFWWPRTLSTYLRVSLLSGVFIRVYVLCEVQPLLCLTSGASSFILVKAGITSVTLHVFP